MQSRNVRRWLFRLARMSKMKMPNVGENVEQLGLCTLMVKGERVEAFGKWFSGFYKVKHIPTSFITQ